MGEHILIESLEGSFFNEEKGDWCINCGERLVCDHGEEGEHLYVEHGIGVEGASPDQQGITFEGPIEGNINIYLSADFLSNKIGHKRRKLGGERPGRTSVDFFGCCEDFCDYQLYFETHPEMNENETIAYENDLDMIGFIADYTHYEP